MSLPPAEDDEPRLDGAASRRRKELPIAGHFPDQLELILGNEIYIAKDGLAPDFETVDSCRGVPKSRVL